MEKVSIFLEPNISLFYQSNTFHIREMYQRISKVKKKRMNVEDKENVRFYSQTN